MDLNLLREPQIEEKVLRNPNRGIGPTHGPTRNEQTSHCERTIWACYWGNSRDSSSRGIIILPRSSQVFIHGHPFTYLLQGTHWRAQRTQYNYHLHINELLLPNVNHIKYWMTGLNGRNTLKSLSSSWSRSGRKRGYETSISLNLAKSWIVGGMWKMAIKGGEGQHE